MTAAELFAIVDPWYNAGSLSDNLKPVVQAFYTELTGDPGERCRTCPSYWNDVLHDLRVHLSTFGYRVMDLKTKKYIIRKDAAFLQVHGLPYVYINKGAGPESDSAKHLTDAIAIKLLEEKPDRAEVIILNPDYEEPVAKLPKDPGTGKSKTAAKHKGTGKKKVDSVPPVAPPAPADQTDTQTDPAPPAAAPSSDSGSDDQNDDDDPADDDEGVDEEDENKDSDSNDQ